MYKYFMYVYDSQIVHPTPQCFKSFYPVKKAFKVYIYIYIYIYI